LAARIVRAPHHVVDADDVAQANADGVLLVIDILERLRPSLSATPALLDVGCGRGQLADAARQLAYRVSAIECHPAALAVARDRVDKLLPMDLTDQNTVAGALEGQSFDVILFADVLEHIPDPLNILQFYLRFLKTGGRIVVSLPNVASWDRRLALLFGYFDYADSGIMDRTHLRFFTFHTAQTLLEEAGLAVLSVRHAPGITRAFLPLIKRFLTKNDVGTANPGKILNSVGRGEDCCRFASCWSARVARSAEAVPEDGAWRPSMRSETAASCSARRARDRGMKMLLTL
jgi:SAM-dependent methyltransferase